MLRLEVLDFDGPTRWRWRLTQAENGEFVEDWDVRLDSAASQFEAFGDLERYLRWRATPDRRVESEAELVAALGAWIGERVLGRVGRALVERAPVTVLVEMPEDAALLAYRPLELGWVDGRPLSVQGVSLVLAPPALQRREKATVGERLRMLGIFSLPVDASALNLRRERVGLSRLVHEIAATHGRAVELRILQYGVTRLRLREVMLERDGWDVVHVSGHGLPAGLLLEREDGRHDLVSSRELVALLEPAAAQLKLVLMSSCESAALTAAQHLELLGINPQPSTTESSAGDATINGGGSVGDGGALPAVAVALAGRLDCAVVAMRYPVVDEFAIELAERLYDLVLGKGQPLARALGLTMPDVVHEPPTQAAPAISVATPALFGARAADLVLDPPMGAPLVFDAEREKLARFPPQPRHFVGRVGAMTRATRALAPRSGSTGVLFHGMAGAGKTACALELAYTHEQSFVRLVWHQAPTEQDDLAPSLSRLALDLETQLPGLRLAHLIDDVEQLRGFLPTLTNFLARNRVLIVVDNCESLITDDGRWRDERWGMVIDALAGHQGLSRLIVTSRRRPASLPAGMLVDPVHALAIAEAVLLAREWPHLRALLDGSTPGLAPDAARALAARTLAMAQGHPKLIELADGQAADPAALHARLSEADDGWRDAGIQPDLFLEHGESAATATDYLRVLDRWTRASAGELPEASRLLFAFLCCLEPDDRVQPAVTDNWPDVWRHLERPGEPPDVDSALWPLSERALVDVERDLDGQPLSYHLHPAVAATGRADADTDVPAAVDYELAAYWLGVLRHALEREDEELGWLILRAGRGALPYLLRQHAWRELIWVSGSVMSRDQSPRTTAAMLPLLRDAATTGAGTDQELDLRRLVARALITLRPDEAATQYRELLDSAEARGDYMLAGVIAADLVRLTRDTGRLQDALDLNERMQEDDRRAGLGPWTLLGDEAQRLQILVQMGHYEEVLDAVAALRARMTGLPERSEQPETVEPFNARELILDTGSRAALALERWEEALAINAECLESTRRRGAPVLEVARTAFNDYGPLLRLGRLDDARALLLACRDTSEQEGDVGLVSKTLTALADLENKLGHGDEATALEADALRLSYHVGNPEDIAISHFNLSNYLALYGGDATEALAHRLAAAVIRYKANLGRLVSILRDLAIVLEDRGASAVPSWQEVCELVDRRDGVHLADLVGRLPASAADRPDPLAEVIRLAREVGPDLERHLPAWEPVISALLAAQAGDQDAARLLDQSLTARAQQSDWTALSDALRRLGAGDHDPQLLAGLDDIDTAIAQRALDALNGLIEIDANAWHALAATPEDEEPALDDQLAALSATVVAAARGDYEATNALESVLADMAASDNWVALAGVVHRILDGERDPALLDGLDPTDSAIVTSVLGALADEPKRNPVQER